MRPLRSLSDWLDDRTGFRKALHAPLGETESVVTHGIRAALVVCFGVLAISGVSLMTVYAPAPQAAWASTHYIQFVAPYGWAVRGFHFWAAQGFLLLAPAHVLSSAFARGYRPPQEIVWWLTLVIVGLAMAEGITGGLLPWDQRGWWARALERNILGMAPIAGVWMRNGLSGGPELGALALTRAYTLHIAALPTVLTVAMMSRRRLRRQGAAAATCRQLQPVVFGVILGAVMACVGGLTAWRHGAPLEAPADPLSDYPIRPEWYLLPLYELRALFSGPTEFWAITMVPTAAASYFALLPWIDRPGRRRYVVLTPAVLASAGAVGLGLASWMHDRRDAGYTRARREADTRAALAIQLAMNGVPPDGALRMVRRDPEFGGRDLFDRHCASCHAIDGLGDVRQGFGPELDGWGTVPWIEAMLHDPDAPEFFGKGPYRGKMPSSDTATSGQPAAIKSPDEMRAVALFLKAQGDETDDSQHVDASQVALGEMIVRERCTDCHIYEGVGDVASLRTAPELSRYGSLAWTVAQIRNPATDRTYRAWALLPSMRHHMPRFDADMSQADIMLVARWTREHARELARP